MVKREVMRYSESFKLQVVRDIDSGKYEPCFQAMQAYGIGGCDTVQRWVLKYGKNHLLNKVVKVEKPNEKKEIKKLKDKIRKLESALSDTHIDLILERVYLKEACRTAGIDDVVEFKKKQGIK